MDTRAIPLWPRCWQHGLTALTLLLALCAPALAATAESPFELDANPQARRFYERQGFQHLRDTVFSTASQQSTLHILGKAI